MIKRVYIDNYKSLVDFNCSFDNINLILGSNGGGKSTLFEALHVMRSFVNGSAPIAVFRDSTLTRWHHNNNIQTFEITIEGNNGTYIYHLQVEHDVETDKQRVLLESVQYDGNLLYKADLDSVYLYHDDYSAVSEYPKDWTQSGLMFIGERRDNTKITWLKKWFKEKLFVVQLDPVGMKPMAGALDSDLDIHARNFVGWYRHRISTDMAATIELFNSLQPIYDNFSGISLEREGGDIQHLYATMGVQLDETGSSALAKYSFADLSDGERCLIVLYALLQLTSDSEITLCIDEPDNYLGLAEIQPWLLKLEDQVETFSSQVLIISHHPEVMNYLANDCGIVLSRLGNSKTRVSSYIDNSSGLLPSELAIRGDLA